MNTVAFIPAFGFIAVGALVMFLANNGTTQDRIFNHDGRRSAKQATVMGGTACVVGLVLLVLVLTKVI